MGRVIGLVGCLYHMIVVPDSRIYPVGLGSCAYELSDNWKSRKVADQYLPVKAPVGAPVIVEYEKLAVGLIKLRVPSGICIIKYPCDADYRSDSKCSPEDPAHVSCRLLHVGLKAIVSQDFFSFFLPAAVVEKIFEHGDK